MQEIKIKDIPELLEKELPLIINKIAKEYNIFPYINNSNFLEERLYPWHQFGLLTHTKKVREVFLDEMRGILEKWGVYKEIEDNLSKEIGLINKKTLLEISIPLHDLGKIICFNDKRTDRQHELLSTELISKGFLKEKIKNYGLSEEQIDYIKGCIEIHDVLGKEIRDKLKHENKLNLDYLTEENINNLCKDLAEKYTDFKIEIGIFFLCDLLGKIDIRINSKKDGEIRDSESEIERVLKKRNLPIELKKAIMQLPVSLKLVEVYLKSVMSRTIH